MILSKTLWNGTSKVCKKTSLNFVCLCILFGLISGCGLQKSADWNAAYAQIINTPAAFQHRCPQDSHLYNQGKITKVLLIAADLEPLLLPNIQAIAQLWHDQFCIPQDQLWFILNHPEPLDIPEVTLYQNQQDHEIIKILFDFIKSSSGQNYLIYFLGHGVQFQGMPVISVQSQGYQSYLAANELQAVIQTARANCPRPGFGAIVLDTCYSGALTEKLHDPCHIVASSVDAQSLSFANEGGGIYTKNWVKFLQTAAEKHETVGMVESLQHAASTTRWYHQYFGNDPYVNPHVEPQLYVENDILTHLIWQPR